MTTTMRSCRRCRRRLPKSEFPCGGFTAGNLCIICTETPEMLRPTANSQEGRRCARCGRRRHPDLFEARGIYCLDCIVRFGREPERIPESPRVTSLPTPLYYRHGMPWTEHQSLMGKPCPLGCGRTTSVIDHNHTTGQVRGALCVSCNAALGVFGDDPTRIRLALQWLERPLEGAPMYNDNRTRAR